MTCPGRFVMTNIEGAIMRKSTGLNLLEHLNIPSINYQMIYDDKMTPLDLVFQGGISHPQAVSSEEVPDGSFIDNFASELKALCLSGAAEQRVVTFEVGDKDVGLQCF